MIGFVVPVIWSQVILIAVAACNQVAQRCIGVQLAVLANHGLSGRYIIYIVAQAEAASVVNQICVGPLPCASGILAKLIGSIVIQSLVIHFIVAGGVVHHVIATRALHVGTPFHVHCNLGVLVHLAGFGGNQDDTVTATRTI